MLAMLSIKNKELLCFGYARSNCKKDLPKEIILSFIQWLSDRIFVNMDSNAIQKFLSSKPEESYCEYILQLPFNLSVKCELKFHMMNANQELHGHLNQQRHEKIITQILILFGFMLNVDVIK